VRERDTVRLERKKEASPAWLVDAGRLPDWHVRSPAGTAALPERQQSQGATTGDGNTRSAPPPAAANQELERAGKAALICPLFSFSLFLHVLYVLSLS